MPLITYVFIAECKNYKSLTDSTRKLNVSVTQSYMKVDATDQGPYKSVDWQGNAWYRVMGDAGKRIPEYPFTSVQSGYGHCGTWCPGYLPGGSHPQTPGELVNNVKVCYNCGNVMCNFKNINAVKIRHCGDYFVYYLTQSGNNENFRYCTE